MLGKVGEFLSGIKSKVEADPQLYEAMMMTAAGLMQSPKPGENALDPVGRAMQGGIGYLRQLREQEKARAAQTAKDQRTYELDSRRTDLYGQQVTGQNEASRRADENADLDRQQRGELSAAELASRERTARTQAGATVTAAGLRKDGSSADEPKIFGVPQSVFDRQVDTYAKLYGKPREVAEFEMFQQTLTKLTPQVAETRLATPTAGLPTGFPVADPAATASRIMQPNYPNPNAFAPQPTLAAAQPPRPQYKPGQKVMLDDPRGGRQKVEGTVVVSPDGTMLIDVGGQKYKMNTGAPQ